MVAISATYNDGDGNTNGHVRIFQYKNEGRINNSTPTIKGVAEADSNITLYKGTTILGTAKAEPEITYDQMTGGSTKSANGNWSITLNEELADGTHTLTVSAIVSLGNPAATTNVEIIDTTTETPTISEIS